MIKKIIKENYIYMIIICLLIIVLTCVFRSSLHDKIILFDYKVIVNINKIIDNNLTTFFKIMTFFGDFHIPIVILVCILLFIKNKWYFYLQSGSYLMSVGVAYLAKILSARPRPIEALIRIPISYSFPSGHTLTAIVFYIVLSYLLIHYFKIKNKTLVYSCSILLILIVGFSRIYLGVHYFSDVMGGIILGIPTLFMCLNIIEKNFKKKL